MSPDPAPCRFREIDHPWVEAIPAFTDNYIWLLRDSGNARAAVVDPGDAAPVMAALEQHRLSLASILITHHHRDHTGGVTALVSATGAQVLGPSGEAIPGIDLPLAEGDRIPIWPGGPVAEVIAIPGHTLGHIAYRLEPFGGDRRGLLFCGDTLFAAGCGRVFEGTPAQMLASLDRLAALPGDTLVFCAHEYTVGNLRFARAAEPEGLRVAERLDEALMLRAAGRATLPSSIAIERGSNPFFRADDPALDAGIQARLGRPPQNRVERFATLRDWKNQFR